MSSASPSPRPPSRPTICKAPSLGPGALVASLALVVSAAAGAPAAAQDSYAFTGVTVLPMDGSGPLPGRTVVVRGPLIAEVGPEEDVSVPGDARVIDGSGRRLMPGLAEMHAHVPPVPRGSPEWPDRESLEDILFLYLANGITTIRGMLGADYQLELEEMLAAGEMLGPNFYVGAPSLNGQTAPDPDAAELLIRTSAVRGYDFQKIHPGLDRPTWNRMASVARELRITFAGHVPTAVGLEHALATGMSTVDHLDGFVPAVATERVRRRLAGGEEVPLGEVVGSAREERIREVARMTRAAGTWVVPTMYLWENLYGNPDPDEMLGLPEMRYVSPEQRETWADRARSGQGPDPATVEAHNRLRRRILRVLDEEGVGVLMGTDSPQLFNVPGFSLHREIGVMSEAGLSNRRILESGTRDVARYVGEELGEVSTFGAIRPGYRADLLLLEGDPLDDLASLEEPAGVMVRGRWVSGSEIRSGLERIAEKHRR